MTNRRALNQKTCAVCGGDLPVDGPVSVEPLIDPSVRYIYVHWDCHSFVQRSAAMR